jgi:hypothetical protein
MARQEEYNAINGKEGQDERMRRAGYKSFLYQKENITAVDEAVKAD